MKQRNNAAILKVIAATVTGTTAMTAFSYMISSATHQQFRESEVLNKILARLGPYRNNSEMPGWALHYLTGLVFVMTYDRLWRKTNITPTAGQAALLGAISGVAGVGIWKVTLALHPNPPAIDRKNYYRQLIAAHVIFGVFSALGYRMIDDEKLDKRIKSC